jgi:hypothetical protein
MILFSKAGNRNCPLVQRHGVALQALEIALSKVICPNTSAKSPHHATAAWTAAAIVLPKPPPPALIAHAIFLGKFAPALLRKLT